MDRYRAQWPTAAPPAYPIENAGITHARDTDAQQIVSVSACDCRTEKLKAIHITVYITDIITSDQNQMNKAKRTEIFTRLRAANPKPTTELIYHSPFELLIAVILSAQTTDKSVNKATEKLFTLANTPKTMLALGEAALSEHIRTIGLFNTKAKNIIKTCAILTESHQGEVPRERSALEALPGVGRKTANVILNTAFGEPTIAVDTHIFRVANRTRIAQGKTPLAVEQQLLRLVPREFLKDAHHWLILHGRYTCTARRPRCTHCLIADLCENPGQERT
ncbi:Endonuclease III [Thiorhodovibrio winogradskyi]|uniref:Endonuclease III n=2 Tax=Thiorhodovibrio winogradskyi TaxID=77007 RepID=A0ABZ0SBY7_9GAMM